MILPKSNISIMDVRNCLAYPSTDLGTLCSCPNINPWSKYKPLLMKQEAVDWVLNGNRLIDYEGWEKGNMGTYGFTFPIAMSHTSIRNGANWEYNPPTGGTRQPFILGSFAGYNSEARPFFMSNIKKDNNSFTVNRTAQTTYGFGGAIALSSDDQIGFNDFENSQIGNSYFSILMYYDNNTTNPTVVSCDSTLANGGSIIRLDLTKSPFTIDRTWDIYLCFRTSQDSGTYYPIPWTDDNYYNMKLKIVSESPFDTECTQFSGTYNRGYTDIRPYALSNVDPSQNKYYPTRGPLYFKMILTTKGTATIDMSRMQMTLESTSYFQTQESMTPVMYDSNFNSIDSVRIYPNQETTIYVGSAYALNSKNGSAAVPPTNTKIYSLIRIKYRDEIIFSTGLNVTT